MPHIWATCAFFFCPSHHFPPASCFAKQTAAHLPTPSRVISLEWEPLLTTWPEFSVPLCALIASGRSLSLSSHHTLLPFLFLKRVRLLFVLPGPNDTYKIVDRQ